MTPILFDSMDPDDIPVVYKLNEYADLQMPFSRRSTSYLLGK